MMSETADSRTSGTRASDLKPTREAGVIVSCLLEGQKRTGMRTGHPNLWVSLSNGRSSKLLESCTFRHILLCHEWHSAFNGTDSYVVQRRGHGTVQFYWRTTVPGRFFLASLHLYRSSRQTITKCRFP